MSVVPSAISTVAWFTYGSPMYHKYVELGLGVFVFYDGEYRKFGSAELRQALLRGRRLVDEMTR